MLQPARRKYRKEQKGRNKGVATSGAKVAFGEFGLKAVGRGRLTARQIEAARRAMTRHVKRGGRIWIRIFPDKPISKKPAEVRMGNGKGSPEYFVAEIVPGKVLYEMDGVAEALAREALALRERLRPYLQRVVEEAARTGLPVQRPMVLACPEDRASWAFEDQFFFGADLLVAPCLEPSGQLSVYLPAGEWRWLDDGRPIEGGRVHQLQVPLARIAAFVRAGHQVV